MTLDFRPCGRKIANRGPVKMFAPTYGTLKAPLIFAYVQRAPSTYTLPAKSLKDLGGYWTKVHEIFIRHRGIIGGVNATLLSNTSRENGDGVCQFSPTRHKSVTIATSL